MREPRSSLTFSTYYLPLPLMERVTDLEDENCLDWQAGGLFNMKTLEADSMEATRTGLCKTCISFYRTHKLTIEQCCRCHEPLVFRVSSISVPGISQRYQRYLNLADRSTEACPRHRISAPTTERDANPHNQSCHDC